ncbi:TetR/AcrR family transcriptional regulator [Dyella sp.]|uniref:TetR/AcrR family transcriptional regulator n=1 Tax=Dyella sp. TaxID=1869338 RepID=UPI002ED2D1DB
MRVSRELVAEHRQRILDAASTLFREHGFDGIGIADIMKAAGMTHGGFYRHFKSREDLLEQACTRAMAHSAERWENIIGDGSDPASALSLLRAMYLSSAHRSALGRGCAVAALGMDAARQPGPVRKSFASGFNVLADKLTRLVPGTTAAVRRRRALVSLTQMVGALVIARAVDDAKLSAEVLTAALDDR